MLAVFAERLLGDQKDEKSKLASKLAATWKMKAVKSAGEKEKEDTMAQLKVLRTHADFDAYGNAPPEEHRVFKEAFLDNGKNGFACLEREGCELMDVHSDVAGDVSILLHGDLSKMRSIATINVLGTRDSDGETILKKYAAAAVVHNNFGTTGTKFSETPLLKNEFKNLKGSYAVVLYDRKWKRIVVARDPGGQEALYWGVQTHGEGMVVSSDEQVVIKECKRYCEFPAGGMYISEKGRVNHGNLDGKKIIDPVLLTPPPAPPKPGALPEPPERRERRHTVHAAAESTPPRVGLVRQRRAVSQHGVPEMSPYSPMRANANSCFSQETAAHEFALRMDREWIAEHSPKRELAQDAETLAGIKKSPLHTSGLERIDSGSFDSPRKDSPGRSANGKDAFGQGNGSAPQRRYSQKANAAVL